MTRDEFRPAAPLDLLALSAQKSASVIPERGPSSWRGGGATSRDVSPADFPRTTPAAKTTTSPANPQSPSPGKKSSRPGKTLRALAVSVVDKPAMIRGESGASPSWRDGQHEIGVDHQVARGGWEIFSPGAAPF